MKKSDAAGCDSNIPDESVPYGVDDSDNWFAAGVPQLNLDFEPKAHWDLGVDLGIINLIEA